MLCPRCQQGTMAFDEDAGTMRCPDCGFRLFRDSLEEPPDARETPSTGHAGRQSDAISGTSEMQPMPSATSKSLPIPIRLPHVMDWSLLKADSEYERIRVKGHCEDALVALARGDPNAARRALRLALDLAPEFDQAWLFLAGLAQDADEQRDYLEYTLACNPTNELALEAMLRLDGRLDDIQPTENSPLEPGQVAAKPLACPHCGGRLDYDVGSKEVHCHHCGHRILDADEMVRSGQQTVLLEGLLKRKHQAQNWNVGGRWLRCTGCGATTTLSPRAMIDTCRFCGSRHILQESIHHRFEQPDLIVPFSVGEDEARTAIDQALAAASG